MKQFNNETKTLSQTHQSIGDGMAAKDRFILKLKPTKSFVLIHPSFSGAGVNLCKGPPGRTRFPVTANCLNPGNIEATLPELVEGSINKLINFKYLIKYNNQLSTNN